MLAVFSGLGHLVAWLSDPDNLNQLVVSQLAIVTSKNSVEELYGSDTEKASLASQESKGEGGDSDVWVAVIFCTPLTWLNRSEPQSNDCNCHLLRLKLELTWVCLVAFFFFLLSPRRSSHGTGNSDGTRTKGKGKGVFSDRIVAAYSIQSSVKLWEMVHAVSSFILLPARKHFKLEGEGRWSGWWVFWG